MGKKSRKNKRKPKQRKPAEVSTRAYEAAMSTPGRRHVVGAGGSQDHANDMALERIRHWGRYLDENHDLAHGILDDQVKNVVGRGIVVIPRPLNDGEVNEALADEIGDLWGRWVERPDVTGELSFNALQRIACRSWLRDGEVFGQHIMGRMRGFPFTRDEVPYRVEMLESEMVPVDLTNDRWRQGVEHDAWMRPRNYAVYRENPDDRFGHVGTFSDTTMKVVPAEDMVHAKFTQRWPATRGTSLFASVVARLYDIKDLEESERLKNRVLASWCAAIVKSPDMPGFDDTDDQGNRYLEMASGTIIDTLTRGESITGVGPDYPVANMPDHINDQIRRLAAGVGSRHSSISRRYDGNYAAQRQEMVESEATYKIREDSFITQFLRPIYRRFVQIALLDNKLSVRGQADLYALSNAEYRGPATPWIDPLKEAQADKLLVDEGFTTLDAVRIKRGAPAELIGQDAPEQMELLPRPAAPVTPIDGDEEEAA